MGDNEKARTAGTEHGTPEVRGQRVDVDVDVDGPGKRAQVAHACPERGRRADAHADAHGGGPQVPGGGTEPQRGAPRSEMLPIWFWVGLILTVYGIIVTALGLAGLGGERPATVLAELHPGLWWGGLMLAGGLGLLVPHLVLMRRRRRRSAAGNSTG